MKFSSDVTAALTALTSALDDPAIDIARSLDQLAETVRLAVPSCVGMSVRSGIDGTRVELMGRTEDPAIADIGASLLISLPSASVPAARTTIVLYARTKGAFVDLAADIAWLGGTRVSDIVLDAHLVVPTYADPRQMLLAMSAVNQAIGMLLGHGYTPEQAERHIYERAARADTSTHLAADMIIRELLESGPASDGGADSPCVPDEGS